MIHLRSGRPVTIAPGGQIHAVRLDGPTEEAYQKLRRANPKKRNSEILRELIRKGLGMDA